MRIDKPIFFAVYEDGEVISSPESYLISDNLKDLKEEIKSWGNILGSIKGGKIIEVTLENKEEVFSFK